jgi:hypothetical protein
MPWDWIGIVMIRSDTRCSTSFAGVGLVAFGVVAQAEAVADEEQHQAVFCCCLAPASGEVQRRVEK